MSGNYLLPQISSDSADLSLEVYNICDLSGYINSKSQKERVFGKLLKKCTFTEINAF